MAGLQHNRSVCAWTRCAAPPPTPPSPPEVCGRWWLVQDCALLHAMRFIKQWAQRRGYLGAKAGGVPSLGYSVMLLHVWQQLHNSPTPSPPCPCISHPSTSPPSPLPPPCLHRACLLLLDFFSYVPLRLKASARSAFCFAVLPVDEHQQLQLQHVFHVFHAPDAYDVRRFAGTFPDPEHRGFGRAVYVQDPFLPRVNVGRSNAAPPPSPPPPSPSPDPHVTLPPPPPPPFTVRFVSRACADGMVAAMHATLADLQRGSCAL